MKLKNRFKIALFEFFREEILNFIKSEPIVEERFISEKGVEVIEIRTQIVIEDNNDASVYSAVAVYEKALEDARKQLFGESMKHVKIDTRSVMDQGVYPHRTIRVSLLIGVYPELKENKK